MKKLLAIGLMLVLALTVALSMVVVGCGDEAADDTETTVATESTEAPADEATEEGAEDAAEEGTEEGAEDTETTVAE